MLAAQKKTGRILQVGSQCVSSIVYEKARELLASGAIGKVNLIEGWTNRNSVMGALHWPIPKDASPQTIDWDRFLGQAPEAAVRAGAPLPLAALQRLRHGHHRRPLRAPVLGDALRHGRPRALAGLLLGRAALLDGRARDPRRHGRRLRLPRARRDAGLQPHAQGQLRGRRRDERVGRLGLPLRRQRGPHGARRRRRSPSSRRPPCSRRTGTPSRRRRRPSPTPRASASPAPDGYDDRLDHFRNFFAAARSRKPVVEDALFGLRAAAPSLLCNLSYDKARPVGWNPETFEVTVA